MAASPTRRNPGGRPRKLPGDHEAFTARLPAEITRILRVRAANEGKSLNDVLVEVLTTWAERDENEQYRRLPRPPGSAPKKDPRT